MAPRTHLTDLGSIASVDLTELGAGKEGWLDNPNVLCALDTNSLAIASRYFLLVLEWSTASGLAGFRVKIRPNLSPIEAEYISALEWFVFDDIRVIAIGTSCGYLLIYSLGGDLIHKQLVYPGRILRLRVRGTKRDITEDTSSFEEVCVVIPGIIARFDGSDIQRVLQRWYQETQNRFWDQSADRDLEESENSYARLPYQLWNVSKYGSCVDAAVTGVMPPPLLELQSSDRYYCAVTIGVDAAISAFRLSEDRSRSFVGAIMSKVFPATFSTIASFSKLLWRSNQPTKKPEPKPQPFARALPLTCLKDHPRKGEKLTLSPSGTLAAITDSLGRIMLLDTRALVVVRLWKGYRDASCLFVERLVNKDTAGAHEHVKNDYSLCLAIHAPRKGIVEIWQMRTGPRILTVPCPKGSKILQPTYRFGSTDGSSSYKPLEVFFLNGDSGQLSRLN
ncbi:rab3 GTPase-activating protein non-catalytic subunit [Cynara cardunculus var. scolymus]|uniref:rab3 GTPase-activating protein non-catalytic subunit n=1 Tax=Cynara cardunculus var. scolymus TaxID=59895 RepID=UPI000D62E4B8|nr:rab3 GTPase-activating protein non-catalytic subunit [Cynara cardunculus var. scolymus]